MDELSGQTSCINGEDKSIETVERTNNELEDRLDKLRLTINEERENAADVDLKETTRKTGMTTDDKQCTDKRKKLNEPIVRKDTGRYHVITILMLFLTIIDDTKQSRRRRSGYSGIKNTI